MSRKNAAGGCGCCENCNCETITLDFDAGETSGTLADWDIVSGSLNSDGEIDSDIMLVSKRSVLCGGSHEAFAVELDFTTDGVAFDVDGITARITVKHDEETDSGFFAEGYYDEFDISEGNPGSTFLPALLTKFGIREAGTDTIVNAVELFKINASNGSYMAIGPSYNLRLYGMLSTDEGFAKRRNWVQTTGPITFGANPGDCFIVTGTTIQNIAFIGNPTCLALPGDVFKYVSGTVSDINNWTKYGYNQLVSDVHIDDAISGQTIREGDVLIAKKALGVSFGDPVTDTISLTAGQGIQLIDSDETLATSWETLNSADVLSSFCLSVETKQNSLVNAWLINNTTPLYRYGSSVFISQEEGYEYGYGPDNTNGGYGAMWTIPSGNKIRLSFTFDNAAPTPRKITDLTVNCTNAITPYRPTCYFPVPAIHARPKQVQTFTPFVLKKAVFPTAPTTIKFNSQGFVEDATYFGSIAISYRELSLPNGVGESLTTIRHFYMGSVAGPDSFDNYTHRYCAIQESVWETTKQDKPREIVKTPNSSYYGVSTAFGSRTTMSATPPFDITTINSSSTLSYNNQLGGASGGSAAATPETLLQHFFNYASHSIEATSFFPGVLVFAGAVTTDNQSILQGRIVQWNRNW